MNGVNYPLEQLLSIKKNRYDQAIVHLEKMKEQLQVEEQKLVEVEKKRDEVQEHRQAKLTQLRDELDGGTTAPKIEQMKGYLKVVEAKLQEEEAKVKRQQGAVDKAKISVAEAKKDVLLKEKDVEKLKIHKKEWEKELLQWTKKEEEKEHDELGSSAHTAKKIAKRKNDP